MKIVKPWELESLQAYPIRYIRVPCTDCEGTGIYGEDTCQRCMGTGEEEIME